MATTTNLTTLKINYLSQAQYDTALANNQINADELYFTPSGIVGSVTSIGISNATDGGLSISGSPITSNGTITIGHSNVLSAAKTTAALYPMKIDKNGHAYDVGSAVTVPTITLNGSSTTSPSFYAPTGAGTSGYYLKSNGSGAPTWASITIPTITLNGSSTTSLSFYAPTGAGTSGQYLKSNGSGAPTWTNFPTIPTITLNGSSTTSPSFYAPTSAGTSGYYLKSNGSGAPSWTSFPTIPTITLNGSSTTSPSFYAPTGAGTSGQILQSNGSGAPSWANMPDTSAFKAYKATNSVELPVLLINGSASQTTTNPSISTSVNAYGAIPNSNAPTVNSSTGALTVNSTTNLRDKIILRKSYNYDTVMPAESAATTGELFFTSEVSGSGISFAQTSDRIYMLGIKSATDDNFYYNENVYAESNVLYGAAWNDYAEYRESFDIEPGRVIIELGNGRLIRSTERLQAGAEVISDTYGFIIGKGNPRCSTPVAVSGRVLVFTYEDRHSYSAGDAVCSGPNGTISKMTREEIKEYPERIIGTVSEIPEYEFWGENNIKVNNRIWIRMR